MYLENDLIRTVEEASLNAWPAHQTLVYRGWLLRFANGYTRRSNSINPIYPMDLFDPKTVAVQIADCEATYQARGLPPIFKITPLAPTGLDDLLESRGYTREASTTVRIRPLAHLSSPAEDGTVDIQIETIFSDAWVHCFADFSNYTATTKTALLGILRNILPERCFVTLRVDSQPIACGLGVMERTWVGLFDIVTAASARGRGYGTQLLQAILGWGKEKGAEIAYLQVMDDNLPARRLYDKLGFSEIYPYWYRVAPKA